MSTSACRSDGRLDQAHPERDEEIEIRGRLDRWISHKLASDPKERNAGIETPTVAKLRRHSGWSNPKNDLLLKNIGVWSLSILAGAVIDR